LAAFASLIVFAFSYRDYTFAFGSTPGASSHRNRTALDAQWRRYFARWNLRSNMPGDWNFRRDPIPGVGAIVDEDDPFSSSSVQ
jgi:hypothetical protein